MKRIHQALLALALATGAAAAQTQPLEIAIAPKPLDRALEEFAVQSGLQVVYVSELASARSSPGFSGRAPVETVLAALLRDTTLTWRFANERTLFLVRAPGAQTEVAASVEAETAEETETGAAAEQSRDDPGEQAGDQDRSVSGGSGSGRASSGDDEEPAGMVQEEVVVTAQFREQTLREVPLSITVLDGKALEREGIVSLREISRRTPGFTSSTFNESEPIFAVRGASNTFSQAGTNKPVGIFLDGVYVSRNTSSAFDLYDLERVEILRGPQGTLFGRNVTGGAIVLNTAKPSFGPAHARVDLGYGNFDTVELRGTAGSTLGESVAGKLSANLRQADGWGEDRLTGLEQNDVDTTNLRGQLSLLLSDQAVLRLTADYAEDENGGRTLSTSSPRSADDGDLRTSEHGHPQRYDRDITAFSAHLSFTGSRGELESISAYREADSFEDFAFSSTHYSFLPRFNPGFPFQQIGVADESPRTFSEELRWVSAQSDRFDYVVGLYWFDEDIDRRSTTLRLGGRDGDTIRDQTFDQSVDTESWAGYTDLHLQIADSLHLNLGGRYTRDSKDVQVDFEDRLRPSGDFSSPSFSESWSEVTPRLALTWFPSDATSVFASVTQGFTSGGFNTEEDTPEVIGTPFDAETLTAYELGVKTALYDRRLQLAANVFHQDYQDKQEGFLDSRFNFVIVNAAEATMDGAEAEISWSTRNGLRLAAYYAYLDATYDEFFIAGANDDRSGNFLPTSPEDSAGFALDWRGEVGSGELAFNGSWTWQDDYYTGSENRPTFLIESYSLVNASLSYGPRDGFWRLTAWGKNLADEDYVLIRSDFTVGGVGEYYGAPRQYGLRVTLDY